MTDEKNLPEKIFSTGAINATIWKNEIEKEDKKQVFRTIKIERRYKDKNDTWQSSNYLRVNDLPKAMLVLSKAYEYLTLRDTKKSDDGTEAETDIDDIDEII